MTGMERSTDQLRSLDAGLGTARIRDDLSLLGLWTPDVVSRMRAAGKSVEQCLEEVLSSLRRSLDPSYPLHHARSHRRSPRSAGAW